MAKTDGHAVENTLEDVTFGDSSAAWKVVINHFTRATTSGRSTASKAFWNSTMATTNTTLIEWGTRVSRLARDLIRTGGTAGDEEQATVLLDGLLPEFKPIKTIIMADGTMNLQAIKIALEEYATNNGLADLRSQGQSTKNRVFYGDDKLMPRDARTKRPTAPAGINPEEQCRMWKLNKCKWGDKCFRRHDGPGGCVSIPPPKKQKTVSCNFCQGDGHILKDCTLFKENSPGVSVTKEAHVHSTHSAPTNPHPRAVPMPMHISGQVHHLDGISEGRHSERIAPGPVSLFPNRSTGENPGTGVITEALPDTEDVSSLDVNVSSALSIVFVVLSLCFGIFHKCVTSLRLLSGVNLPHQKPAFLGILAVAIIVVAMTCQASALHVQGPPRWYVNANVYLNSNGGTAVPPEYEWCSDSGTNRFVTNNSHDFLPGSIVRDPVRVAVGGGSVTSPYTGTVRIKSLDHNRIIECTDVLFLPNCGKKLIPAFQFVQNGCNLRYFKSPDSNIHRVELTDESGAPVLSGSEFGGLFHFRSKTLHTDSDEDNNPLNSLEQAAVHFGLPIGKHISAKSSDFSQRFLEAHYAAGHMHFDKLRKLFGLKKFSYPDCTICTIANQRQQALSKHPHKRATRSAHTMWMDIGFTAGSRYKFQLYIDDYDRVGYLDVLEGKEQCLTAWTDLKRKIENDKYPAKFARIKTDGEAIYWTPEWDQHCTSEGLEHECSGRYRHDQLGVVERAMQTIGISFRSMMITGNAPESDVPEALIHSNVIRSNSPTKANNGWTPNEKALGKRLPPNRRLFRCPLFCLVFACIYKDERVKHGRRGVACVYLGYDPVNNTYLVKEWETGEKYYTADIEPFPNIFPYRANPQRAIGSLNQYDDLGPNVTDHLELGENVQIRASLRQKGYRVSGGKHLLAIPDVDVPPDPATNIVEYLAAFNVHTGTESSSFSFLVHPKYGPDPETFDEALLLPDADEWILADLREKESFKQLGVADTVLRSQATSRGKRIFKFKEVLKRKFNPPDDDNPFGTLDKYKFRLTIAAYTKTLTEGIDYKDKHAGTVRWQALKILFAIAIKFNYDITLIDISTFFLYGDMEDEVYMEFPDRWAENGEDPPTYVWRLLKSVYGWPAAPNRAQHKLNGSLTSDNKFTPTAADACVYASSQDQPGYAACGTHVDDIFTVGDSVGTDRLISTLKDDFEITVKVNPTCVTGVQISRNRDLGWGKLHQTDYTTKLLDKYQMLNAKTVDTPMDPGTLKAFMSFPRDNFTPQSLKDYQGTLGELMWLRTRPDLNFCINVFSRFVKCASPKHVDVIRGRPLKYLNSTRDYGLVYQPGDGEWVLSGEADSDLAGDLVTSRSTLAINTSLGEYGNISNAVKLERKICTSTGQAETYAFVRLSKEILWERLLLQELGFPQENATKARSDNDGVIIQSKKQINHSEAKHYRISQAFIKQLRDDGVIDPQGVDSAANCADMGTKALLAGPFHRHRLTVMGPQSCPS